MSDIPNCPECDSEYTYEDGTCFVCPDCQHEFTAAEATEAAESKIIRDAVGNVLVDGDTVTVAKDLKIKGTTNTIKVGTKVKNIRLVSGDHDIDCKVPGFGPMKLKSSVVKKA